MGKKSKKKQASEVKSSSQSKTNQYWQQIDEELRNFVLIPNEDTGQTIKRLVRFWIEKERFAKLLAFEEHLEWMFTEIHAFLDIGDNESAKMWLIMYFILLKMPYKPREEELLSFLVGMVKEICRSEKELICISKSRQRPTNFENMDCLQMCYYYATSRVRAGIWLMDSHRSMLTQYIDYSICIKLLIRTSADSKVEFVMRASTYLTLGTLILMLMCRLENPPDKYFILHAHRSESKKRILRLCYDGPEMLFALGFQNNDVLHIVDARVTERRVTKGQCSTVEHGTKQTKADVPLRRVQSKPCKVLRRNLKNGSHNTKKKHSQIHAKYCSDDNNDKINHSMLLTLVFEEAEPVFQKRRQRLSDLALSKTQPKVKRLQPKLKLKEPDAIDTCCSAGLGGKAGKIVFSILIGENEYLYKSSKTTRNVKMQTEIIDLHGCTKASEVRYLISNLDE